MELFKSRARVVYTNAVGDKVYPVVVDIKKGIKSTEEVTFVSSDINTGILSVAFVQGNEVYNVSGAEVVCSVMRPDASTLEIPCEVVSGNIVEVPLGVNGTSQDGVYSMDFKIFKGGNKVVGTPIMNYSVSLSIGNDMAVEEDDRLPILTMLMTQLTELKGEARESINQANTATVASKEATANAIEATNNANAVSERVSQETSEVISRVNNKVTEVENRFNALTSKQQQDAEVIDARDGETSLKARLDRDIEKAKEIYVGVEGTYVSTDSSSGYAKDVEILGNTVQDASNLADIRSVGDKVEGQELYEIPVLSRGKNLFDGELEPGTYQYNNGVKIPSTTEIRSVHKIKVNPSSNYIISSNKSVGNIGVHYYDSKENFIKSDYDGGQKIVTTEDTHFIAFRFTNLDLDRTVQIEEGTQATPYEEYKESRTKITLPCQLEKVGNVADRIICKDGVWGVEKNVLSCIVEDYSKFLVDDKLSNVYRMHIDTNNNFVCKNRGMISSIVPYNGSISWSKDEEGAYSDDSQTNGNRLWIHISKSKITTTPEDYIRKHLPIKVTYKNLNPTFIPLPHDQQVKLRTFAGQTNIHFETEIEGTIKAQVPKSLGATVNTHTEQINNLNKELDRVKKLEESTVSTVTTESGFTTVEETSNGYFEDVKLEGKTLANIVTTYNTSKFSFKEAIKQEDGYYKLQYGATVNDSNVISRYGVHLYKPNTTYTVIVDIKDNTTGTFLGISAINSPISSQSVTKRDFANLTGISTLLITTRDDITLSDKGLTPIYDLYFGIWKDGGDLSKHITFRYWVIEGDHTQNPPSYFEGLMSAGQDAEEVSVKSVKGDGNLWDGTYEIGSISTSSGMDTSNGTNRKRSFYIPICETKYYAKVLDYVNTDSQVFVHCYDKNKNPIKWNYGDYVMGVHNNTITLTIPTGGRYLKFRTEDNRVLTPNSVLITKSDIIKGDTPHQSDKKRLLYYNEETQTWEKPVLRQWDSIEKHSDGKYYYHKRSEEVVLNGSELEWRLHIGDGNRTTVGMEIMIPPKYNEQNGAVIDIICDKLLCISADDSYGTDLIGVASRLNLIRLRLDPTKVGGTDLTSMKAWLQANPITIVYKLAQEEVYECTNIDLITYSGETNFIVESGAISPRTTLKVHNNISNVVKILQEKVSLLENKFIEGLKKVLAGDMYSLAELLYPEDFKAENSVMTIPLD